MWQPQSNIKKYKYCITYSISILRPSSVIQNEHNVSETRYVLILSLKVGMHLLDLVSLKELITVISF
jgi:hypothetical protein